MIPMRTDLPLLLGLLLDLTACHHDETPAPKQYSTWIVNNHDTFRTNNVDSNISCNPDHSYCSSGIMSKDPANWFSLGFLLDYLPSDGKYPLYTPPGGGNVLCAIKFYYNNVFYYHTTSRIDTIYVSMANNKPSYAMTPCWFLNYNNPTGDSILVQGVFNVP